MRTNKSIFLRRTMAAVWLTFLLGILAFVFVNTGCGPIRGPRGHAGGRGAPGNPGRDGRDGDSITGPQGPQGIPGLSIVGPMGPAGVNGTNANLSIVPLCPGVSNYGTFIEIGLCFNGDLYAVYSANGGFMTYLAPGNYSSNAIGSACSLTVQPNCIVSH